MCVGRQDLHPNLGVCQEEQGFGAATANAAIGQGQADLVAFGVPFLANPDLVERYRTGAELNGPRFDRLYAGDDEGYIDYPALAGSAGVLDG